MNHKHGSYKDVLVYNNWCIKLPRNDEHSNYTSYLDMLTEQWSSLFAPRGVKKYLLPIYFIPFIPIHLQKRVPVYDEHKDDYIFDVFQKQLENNGLIVLSEDGYKGVSHDSLGDAQPGNLGFYKGKVVKIDYGTSWWFYNLKIKIRRFLRLEKK